MLWWYRITGILECLICLSCEGRNPFLHIVDSMPSAELVSVWHGMTGKEFFIKTPLLFYLNRSNHQ